MRRIHLTNIDRDAFTVKQHQPTLSVTKDQPTLETRI
jgi:hypothetical protein